MRRLDELTPLAPGTLRRICEVLELDPKTVIALNVDAEGVTAIKLDDGRLLVHRMVERA
jgi:hypothetical protein